VHRYSNGAFEHFSAYSMIDEPDEVPAAVFECVVCVLPARAGVMIVDREHRA